MFSLDGSTALVTGPGRGIGQALAVAFAEAGADVVLVGRGEMQATHDRIRGTGRQAFPYTADLSRDAELDTAAKAIVDAHSVDIVVNNAGVIHRGSTLDSTRESWQRVLDVNLTAAYALLRALAPPMIRRRRGKVINIASMLSFQGGIGVSSYAASKHAVVGLTKALANEWGPHGVQVNAIAPGYIETDATGPLRSDPERSRALLDRVPAGRWGTPDDLTGAAVFLASRASDYVNGHVLAVDGGWLSR